MIISRTPLRVSFFGGGTDIPKYYNYYGGKILGTAIDKYTYAFVAPRYDDKIYVGYTKQEVVNSVDEIEHSLVRECAIMTGMKKAFEVKTLADIPSEGSGLGSSSSITVSLLNAFYAYQGKQVSLDRLAEEACRIEIDILNKPIGKQDQYLCALGGTKRILFTDNGINDTISYKSVDLSEEEKYLHLFYTGITRKSDPILSNQITNMDYNVDKYEKLKYLVDSKDSFHARLLDSWNIKKELSTMISNPEIEEMIETAKHGGAWAWKILGAGGGGFLLTYSNPKDYDDLKLSMKNYRELPFKFESHGSKIIFNYR
jgi:D-glycero-alpha-D-manno-heptose-7-phosphate kinase